MTNPTSPLQVPSHLTNSKPIASVNFPVQEKARMAARQQNLSDSELLQQASAFRTNSIASQVLSEKIAYNKKLEDQAKMNAKVQTLLKPSLEMQAKASNEFVDAIASLTAQEIMDTPVDQLDALIESKKGHQRDVDYKGAQRQFYLDNPAELMKLPPTERISLSRTLGLN